MKNKILHRVLILVSFSLFLFLYNRHHSIKIFDFDCVGSLFWILGGGFLGFLTVYLSNRFEKKKDL